MESGVKRYGHHVSNPSHHLVNEATQCNGPVPRTATQGRRQEGTVWHGVATNDWDNERVRVVAGAAEVPEALMMMSSASHALVEGLLLQGLAGSLAASLAAALEGV